MKGKIDLEKNVANIDVDNIRELYSKAKVLVPNLQRTFEDTLLFHNEMLENNIQFISEELPQLEKKHIRRKEAYRFITWTRKEIIYKS